jgi:hypothetical protein
LKQSSIVKEHPAWRASYVERPSQEFYPWCNISKIPKHYSQLFQAQFDWFFKKCSFLPFENAIKPLAFILVSGPPAEPRYISQIRIFLYSNILFRMAILTQSPFMERIIRAMIKTVGRPSQIAGMIMFVACALCE